MSTKKWEHREYVHMWRLITDPNDRIFAVWGLEGWELVTVVMIEGWPHYFFKRLIDNGKSSLAEGVG